MLLCLPPDIKFQQDGAQTHFSHTVQRFLDGKLPDSWIGRGGPPTRPASSPGLTPLDFFLCGYVEEKLYHIPCPSLSQSKRRISFAFPSVRSETVQNVFTNAQAQLCTVPDRMLITLNVWSTRYKLRERCSSTKEFVTEKCYMIFSSMLKIRQDFLRHPVYSCIAVKGNSMLSDINHIMFTGSSIVFVCFLTVSTGTVGLYLLEVVKL